MKFTLTDGLLLLILASTMNLNADREEIQVLSVLAQLCAAAFWIAGAAVVVRELWSIEQ